MILNKNRLFILFFNFFYKKKKVKLNQNIQYHFLYKSCITINLCIRIFI